MSEPALKSVQEAKKTKAVVKEDKSHWRWQIKNRITTLQELSKWIKLTSEEKKAIDYSAGRLKMAITPHFAGLMDKNDPECPIRKQAVPSLDEFKKSIHELKDPCGEEHDTVVPGVVHRYPDRILLLITDACAMYCRHCTRRRLVGTDEGTLTRKQLDKAIQYIKQNKNIRDVLISGGDPFLLSDNKLNSLINRLKAIKHIELIRLGTRVPVTLPQRITPKLVNILKKYHPLYISVHVNHPNEISEGTREACNRISDAGIPLGSQTVLLKGINDKPAIMMRLVHELLRMRIRPYYLYQCDLAPGTEHFRTPVASGIKVIEGLRGHTTGYAVPTFVIDAPGGGGKVPVNPDYVITRNKKGVIIKNYEGKVFVYPERNGGPSASSRNEDESSSTETPKNNNTK